jgi:hypothetical protein
MSAAIPGIRFNLRSQISWRTMLSALLLFSGVIFAPISVAQSAGTVYQCNDAGASGRIAVDVNSLGVAVNLPNCTSMVAVPRGSATLTLQRWHPGDLSDPYAIWQAAGNLPAGWSMWTPNGWETLSQIQSGTTPPTEPTGLTATAESSSTIQLTWSASTDNGGPGLGGYTIYRNGSSVGTTSSTSHTDTGLSASTQYTYSVSAFDVDSNASGQSASASATTQGASASGSGSAGQVYQCNDAGASGRVAVDANSLGLTVTMPDCSNMVAVAFTSATLTLQRWHPGDLVDPYAIWQAASTLPAGWSVWTPNGWQTSAQAQSGGSSSSSSSSSVSLPAVSTGQVSRSGETFPSLANYSIGGAHDYDNSAVIAHAALDDVYVVATWNGWQAGRALTMPQVEAAIASQSVRGTKVVSYFDPLYTHNGSPAYIAQLNAANFWLHCPWPSGTITQYNGANAADVYPGGPTGVGGRTYVQYDADYNVDWMFNGEAAWLATDGIDAVNSGLNGVFMDDLQMVIPIQGDFAHTGSCGSGTSSQMRVGFVSILQRMQADVPGILLFANLSRAGNAANLPVPEYVGAFDGGVMEAMVGQTSSIEQQGSDSSLAVQAYQNEMTLLNSNQLGVFGIDITSNGEDQVNTSVPYQAMRHGLAFCLVVGNASCAFETPATYDSNGDAALWFDEESVNLTTLYPYTTPNASAAPGLGYLGAAVDPPQTGPYQNGYWRRRFQNGEVWWSPREAAAGTIYFSRTVYFINGVQAPYFNTGGSGTSHAISSRDGIVVLY